MKKIVLTGAILAAACLGTPHASQTARDNGFISVTITNGTQRLFSVPFVRPVQHEGVVSAVGASNITDNAAAMTAGEFDSASGDSKYELEVTSGRYIGFILPVASNSSTTVYLSGPVPQQIKQGSTFVVRKQWTLGGLFGTNAAQVASAGIVGGANSGAAGTILRLFDPITQQIGLEYFFNTSAGQWRRTGLDGTNRSGEPIGTKNAFIIQQRVTASTTVVRVAGEVRKTRTLFPGGYAAANRQNLIGNPSPFPMTLKASGMWNEFGESSSEHSVLDAAISANADKVRRYAPLTGQLTDHFHNGTTWRQGLSNADGIVIGAGEGILVQRLNANDFTLAVNPAF